MEGYLESSIINSPLLWLSAAPLTHSSTEADSTSAWLSRGTPRFRHYVRSPLCEVCVRVRVCECVSLWGCWSRMLIQQKGAVRDTGGREKKSPESRRTGVVRFCLLQCEGEERSGLRNSDVVQESWAEPQCCVDETEWVRFTSAERVRHKTSNTVQHN